jgi:hypothetical protein
MRRKKLSLLDEKYELIDTYYFSALGLTVRALNLLSKTIIKKFVRALELGE